MITLKGKTALITGGSSGIGQAIALAYAKAGADIALTYRNNEKDASKTKKMITDLGRKAIAYQADLAKIETLPELMTEIIKEMGCLDILVNNAGTLTRHSSFTNIPIKDSSYLISANYLAPFYLTQIFANHLMTQNKKGVVLNISSISTEVITPGLVHYECSKAALEMLTKSSASELAKYDIRVNAIAPGLIETNMNRIQREENPDAWNMRKSFIPLKRVGKPEDIIPLAVLLVCDQSDWITGSIFKIDGGSSIKSPFST